MLLFYHLCEERGVVNSRRLARLLGAGAQGPFILPAPAPARPLPLRSCRRLLGSLTGGPLPVPGPLAPLPGHRTPLPAAPLPLARPAHGLLPRPIPGPASLGRRAACLGVPAVLPPPLAAPRLGGPAAGRPRPAPAGGRAPPPVALMVRGVTAPGVRSLRCERSPGPAPVPRAVPSTPHLGAVPAGPPVVGPMAHLVRRGVGRGALGGPGAAGSRTWRRGRGAGPDVWWWGRGAGAGGVQGGRGAGALFKALYEGWGPGALP